MEIIAYEMKYVTDSVEKSDIVCIPFEVFFFQEYIREKSNEPITLHVAKWNNDALMLYKKVGFEIANVERVR